jgi:hypothetical protein
MTFSERISVNTPRGRLPIMGPIVVAVWLVVANHPGRADERFGLPGEVDISGPLAPAEYFATPPAFRTQEDLGNLCVPRHDQPAAEFDDCRCLTGQAVCGGCVGRDIFADVPPVRIFPRPGNFSAPPTGPGYHSLADWLAGRWRERAPQQGYPRFGAMPPSFFDADFRYVDDPAIGPQQWSDPLKRIRIKDDWLLSTGGQVGWRFMNEKNSRLSGRDNSYHLVRTRVFSDLWYRDRFRVYAEFLDARIHGADLPPLPIDASHTDLLNAFIDVKAADIAGKPAYVRVGRQELLLGSQRLVSSLDWANTRRTFQGVRTFRQGERFDIDVFWVQPIIPDAREFDWPDTSQNLVGAWTTYRPQPGRFFDLYYLFNNNSSPPGGTPAYDINTFGSRYAGDRNHWLWDVETMIQFGRRGNEDVLAGSVTAGGGYHFADAPMNPRLWVYYDWASGDRNPGSGTFGTFNHLFPFGHYYMGWIDLVARQNIQDVNLHLFLYPQPWITCWLQYHHFQLHSRRDALYNAGGVPLRRDPTGGSGRHVGDEFDVVLNFHLGGYQDIFLGHSVLFPGNFIRQTGPSRTPQLTFVQYSFRW